jgi:D-amino-acid dehydrogenase
VAGGAYAVRVAKVIILGGGIVGAACALEAAAHGAEVVLADAGLPGRATSAGAGIISPWPAHADDPELRSFTTAAAREYPALVERLAEFGATDVSYRKVGALYLCEDAETTARVHSNFRDQRENAAQMGDVRVLSGPDARELFPPLRDDLSAVYVPGAARVDGRKMAAALARAAAALGAVIRDDPARLVMRGSASGSPASGSPARGGPVVGGSASGGSPVRGVEVAGEIIEGDAVVVAAGAWTSSVLEDAGLADTGAAAKVTPQRGQIAHIALPGPDTSEWPVVSPVGTGHYMLAFDDSRVVAGATRETGSGFDYRVTPGGLAEVLNEAIRVAPGLAAGTYIETRIGFRPASPDGRPLLGPVPGVEGLVVATGLGAEGLTAGPYVGAIAAKVALGVPAGIDLTSFGPLRLPLSARSAYRARPTPSTGDA